MKYKIGQTFKHSWVKGAVVTIIEIDHVTNRYEWKYDNESITRISMGDVFEKTFILINKKKSKLPEWF